MHKVSHRQIVPILFPVSTIHIPEYIQYTLTYTNFPSLIGSHMSIRTAFVNKDRTCLPNVYELGPYWRVRSLFINHETFTSAVLIDERGPYLSNKKRLRAWSLSINHETSTSVVLIYQTRNVCERGPYLSNKKRLRAWSLFTKQETSASAVLIY